MFENIMNFFKKLVKKEKTKNKESSNAAKERLHLVLMQDRANVSADFLELMRQEIIEVIKKYIDIDEGAIDVHLTNKTNEDGTVGAPALYANIPIVTIKNDARKGNVTRTEEKQENKNENNKKGNNNNEIQTKNEDNNIEEEKKETNNKTESKELKQENSENKNDEKKDNEESDAKQEENKKEGESIQSTEEGKIIENNKQETTSNN